MIGLPGISGEANGFACGRRQRSSRAAGLNPKVTHQADIDARKPRAYIDSSVGAAFLFAPHKATGGWWRGCALGPWLGCPPPGRSDHNWATIGPRRLEVAGCYLDVR